MATISDLACSSAPKPRVFSPGAWFLATVHAGLQRWQDSRRIKAASRALAALEDWQLCDIGLTRSDVGPPEDVSAWDRAAQLQIRRR